MSVDPNVSRRQFLKQSAAGAAAAGLALDAAERAEAAPAPAGKSKVVVVTNPAIGAPAVDKEAVEAAVHKAVCTLFGTDDVGKAFGRVAGPKDVVALKPNCAGGTKTNCTRLYTVMALTTGLQAAGVPWGKMVVYEMQERLLKNAGYPIMKKSDNVRILGTDRSIGHTTKEYQQGRGEIKQRFSRILDLCTALINVPFLKTTVGMGVSIAMKNHQGSIDNPRANHPGGGAQHLADLNMMPMIRQKTKLVLCDATYPMYDGGPDDNPDAHWPFNAIMAATDPVALDAVGHSILEAKRKELGWEPIPDQPGYIEVAGMRGLGNAKLTEIERIDVEV